MLFFGPDQLPKVARRAGQVVRDVQSTSASFIREMERAADEPDAHPPYTPTPYVPDPPYDPIIKTSALLNAAPEAPLHTMSIEDVAPTRDLPTTTAGTAEHESPHPT